mmetsp:Transcript_9255/g.16779  ORF Transcript_9255/g.16779 Transcript_9255/m.16779 type:complete len:220 (+) Transcript_9255:236-895(+)
MCRWRDRGGTGGSGGCWWAWRRCCVGRWSSGCLIRKLIGRRTCRRWMAIEAGNGIICRSGAARGLSSTLLAFSIYMTDCEPWRRQRRVVVAMIIMEVVTCLLTFAECSTSFASFTYSMWLSYSNSTPRSPDDVPLPLFPHHVILHKTNMRKLQLQRMLFGFGEWPWGYVVFPSACIRFLCSDSLMMRQPCFFSISRPYFFHGIAGEVDVSFIRSAFPSK